MVNGQLRASDAGADRQLSEAIAATTRSGSSAGVKSTGLALLGHDGMRYVAHTLPLGSTTRQSDAVPSARLALFVSRTAIDPPSLPEVIARAYKLTATELRVLLAIVDAGGTPEVADALGIAPSTVKTHLARLYEKTGARRHADLVKVVAGFSTPLR
jgi:DNA-binding CsgD family transcriptional regulator